jgi:hypothetical protein
MIEISRSLARQLRAVFRRIASRGTTIGQPTIVLQAGSDGLDIRLPGWDFAVAYHRPGNFASEELALPLSALEEFAGKGHESVTLQAAGPGRVQAQWQDSGIPQSNEYAIDEAKKPTPFPQPPSQWTSNGPELLGALRDAIETTDDSPVRAGLGCVQLVGSSGRIAATNGKPLLIQEGHRFGWSEAVLNPRPVVMLAKELAANVPVEIGRNKDYVALHIGPWTLFARIDMDARFPAIDQVVPKAARIASRCTIAQADAAFLAQTLPRLPGHDDSFAPVTVDLGDQVVIRAKAAGQDRVSEVVLSGSTASGKAVRFSTNRTYLARAMALGFRELQVVDANTPMLCADGIRQYVWMPLGKDDIVAPTADAVRIASDSSPAARPHCKQERLEHARTATPQSPNPASDPARPSIVPQEPEQALVPSLRLREDTRPPSVTSTSDLKHGAADANDLQSLIDEAEALKNVLRDAYTRTHRVLAAARRQRKQAQVVKAAMASLRQLQQASA